MKRFITLPLVLMSVLLLCLVVYLDVFWGGGYSLYFDQPELSHIPLRIRETMILAMVLFTLSLTIFFIILTAIRFRRNGDLFWIPLPYSILMFCLFYYLNSYYPAANTGYLKDGYMYREYLWRLKGGDKFRRYKSVQSFDKYTFSDTIVWRVDSASAN